MLQLELERDRATENAECVRLAREVKELGLEILARHRARGLPVPELVPHPDDIYIDEKNSEWKFEGRPRRKRKPSSTGS